ncbi:hypothetical protein [Occultella gossypii]|uniref:SRPBCC family protein n=1 Tax=Occultella gossypii TaxID=2800820 RepID=A0ABS7S8I6_9MICO|nr:hypothetical protein [Occultella gossypii]MBZ2196060.1 hypothetical protein [Occultella gossypii]
MSPPVHVTRGVGVAAPLAEVWHRVTTPAGINDELAPFLTMTMPARWQAGTIATAPVGQHLGKAHLRLAGLIPVEYDDLFLVAVSAPTMFHERSEMLTARVWEHRRELVSLADGLTRVTDEVTMIPRFPLPGRAVHALIDALFAHRHRRLRAWADSR